MLLYLFEVAAAYLKAVEALSIQVKNERQGKNNTFENKDLQPVGLRHGSATCQPVLVTLLPGCCQAHASLRSH